MSPSSVEPAGELPATEQPPAAAVGRWAVGAAQIGLAATAFAALPVGTLLETRVGEYLNAEALVLLSLAILLPLPFQQHLWVQLLALRAALTRMPRLAWAQTALPDGGAACAQLVSCARIAAGAVAAAADAAPGASLPAQECCWMVQSWVTIMLGICLPTAVLLAATQHARRLAAWREAQERARALREAEQLRRQVQRPGSTEGSPRSSSFGAADDEQEDEGVLQAAERSRRRRQRRLRRGRQDQEEGGRGSSSDGRRDALGELLPAGVAASDVSNASSSPSRLSEGAAGGSSVSARLVPWAHLALNLFQYLVLLLPVGAALWAALEVAVRFTDLPRAGLL